VWNISCLIRVISARLIKFSKAERKTLKEESDLYLALVISWSTQMLLERIDMFVLQTICVEAGISRSSDRYQLVSRSRGGVRGGESVRVDVDEDAGDHVGREFVRTLLPPSGVCGFKAAHSA
jgi:hypothetical protein